MRHYMVCPQNEEVLHKVPPHVREAIRSEAVAECITLIEESVPWSAENWIAVDERAAILAALRALQEKP